MDAETLISLYKISAQKKGGQELILFEICAEILPVVRKGVWVPFISSGTLTSFLRKKNIHVNNTFSVEKAPLDCDVLYFGTPTIVNDAVLFPEDNSVTTIKWNKVNERKTASILSLLAQEQQYTLIVSGLGSGDISVEERIADMGGGKIVAYKDFNVFQDWVISRRL